MNEFFGLWNVLIHSIASYDFASNLWHLFVFFIIPLVVIFVLIWRKRRLLWTAPLLSLLCNTLCYLFMSPDILTYQESRAMFFMIVVPLHLVTAGVLTAIAYGVMILIQKLSNH